MTRIPDVEAELIAYLIAAIPDVDFSTDTDTTLQDVIPATRLYRVSGVRDSFRLDRPVIDFDTFAADRETAHDVAEQVQDALHALAGNTTAGMVVSQVRTIIAPRWLPYDNTDIRRFSATNALVVHKR